MEVITQTLGQGLRDANDGGMCPHRAVLEHVTSRWGALVLIAAGGVVAVVLAQTDSSPSAGAKPLPRC